MLPLLQKKGLPATEQPDIDDGHRYPMRLADEAEGAKEGCRFGLGPEKDDEVDEVDEGFSQ